ncbi:hypothetical protein FRC03_001881 [Tulasnella sp. 419]|nr:hypothetical protein FRC03_001881 [Tulasnella sp. 419]
MGIKIQEAQLNLRRRIEVLPDTLEDLSPSVQQEIDHLRNDLQSKFVSWRRIGCKVLPNLMLNELMEDLGAVSDSAIEDQAVLLPSSVDESVQKDHPQLAALIDIEIQLRHGQMEDLLQDIRMLVKKRAWGNVVKNVHMSGQKAKTRAQSQLAAVSNELKQVKNDYDRVYKLVDSLDCTGSRNSPFQELKDEDLEPDVALTSQLALGAGLAHLTWIWKVPRGSEQTSEEWAVEVDHVQWFCFQAQKDRWIEEVKILQEEIERLRRYFIFYAQTWEKLLIKSPATRDHHGRNVYIRKISCMYKQFEGAMLDDSEQYL